MARKRTPGKMKKKKKKKKKAHEVNISLEDKIMSWHD